MSAVDFGAQGEENNGIPLLKTDARQAFKNPLLKSVQLRIETHPESTADKALTTSLTKKKTFQSGDIRDKFM